LIAIAGTKPENIQQAVIAVLDGNGIDPKLSMVFRYREGIDPASAWPEASQSVTQTEPRIKFHSGERFAYWFPQSKDRAEDQPEQRRLAVVAEADLMPELIS